MVLLAPGAVAEGPSGERCFSASPVAGHSFCQQKLTATYSTYQKPWPGLHAAVTQLPWRTCIFLAPLLLCQAELQKRIALLLGNITEISSFSLSMMIITKDMQEDFIVEHCPL